MYVCTHATIYFHGNTVQGSVLYCTRIVTQSNTPRYGLVYVPGRCVHKTSRHV